jgi:hypothetical protein
MKTFQDYLRDRNLADDWDSYSKQNDEPGPAADAKGWAADPNEPVRELQQILAQAVDNTQKINKMGIDDIKSEVINSEQVSSGQLCRVELQGTVHAKDPEHIRRLLEKVVMTAEPMLAERGMYMQVLYNQMDINETDLDEDAEDTAIGLVRQYSFRVVAQVLCRNMQREKMTAL